VLKVYIKTNIYELCLKIMFDNVSVNFDKPVMTQQHYVKSIIGILDSIINKRILIQKQLNKKFSKYKK